MNVYYQKHSSISTWCTVFRITRHTVTVKTDQHSTDTPDHPEIQTFLVRSLIFEVTEQPHGYFWLLWTCCWLETRSATLSWESSTLEKILNWMTLEWHLCTFYFVMAYRLFVNFCFYDNSTGVKKRGSNDLSRRVLTKLCCELQSIRWHM